MAFLPLSRVAFYLLSITCLCTGSGAVYVFGPRLLQHWYSSQLSYQLTHVRQIPSGDYSLPTELLVKMLGRSVGDLTNLYALDLAEAVQRLTAVPIFKRITLTKEAPCTLTLAYTLRAPLALVADYSNTAVDSEGVLIPLQPYYSEAMLPTCILGIAIATQESATYPWGRTIPAATAALLQQLLPAIAIARDAECGACCLDLRVLHTHALGEIALFLAATPQTAPRLLRLTSKDYPVQLQRYSALKAYLAAIEKEEDTACIVLDLRLADAALIAPVVTAIGL